VPLALPIDETFDVVLKTGTPIDDHDYETPFTVTGEIDKLTISVEPPVPTDNDEKKLIEARARRVGLELGNAQGAKGLATLGWPMKAARRD
jgi:hypothetical protein